MSTPETIRIDEVEYVRKDACSSEPRTWGGLDYCIVRSVGQGVMCGYVESIDGTNVTMHQARQMWKWDSTFVLIDMAESGPRNTENCKFSVAASNPVIVLSACGVITCTQKAANALIAVEATRK